MKEYKGNRPDTAATAARLLAGLAVTTAAVSAVAGLVVPGLYRDSEGWIRQARAADIVTLLAVAPVLALCIWRGMTGKSRLIAVATLGYLVYTYAIFGFSVAINAMTPLHFAVLGLSVWSLILSLHVLARDARPSVVGLQLPRRTTGVFLLAVAILFAVMWLGQIAAAIATGRVSAELENLKLSTNPVYTLDLAFALPLLAVAGVLLIRRWPRASELGLVAVAWVALMGVGVLAIFAFDAMVAVEIPLEVVAVIGFITAIGASLTVLGLGPMHGQATASAPDIRFRTLTRP